MFSSSSGTTVDLALDAVLLEQRRGGVRREDVERGAFEPVLLDPLDGLFEHARVVAEPARSAETRTASNTPGRVHMHRSLHSRRGGSTRRSSRDDALALRSRAPDTLSERHRRRGSDFRQGRFDLDLSRNDRRH